MPAANRRANADCALPVRKSSACCQRNVCVEAGRYYSAQTKMVGGRVGRGTDRSRDSFDGLERAEAIRSEGEGDRIQDGIDVGKKSLVRLNLRQFCNETLSDSPAPGRRLGRGADGRARRLVRRDGGESFAGKARLGREARFFSEWAVKAQQLKDELLFLVDEDTAAFNKVMAAFGLPKDSPKKRRRARRQFNRQTNMPRRFRFE